MQCDSMTNLEAEQETKWKGGSDCQVGAGEEGAS